MKTACPYRQNREDFTAEAQDAESRDATCRASVKPRLWVAALLALLLAAACRAETGPVESASQSTLTPTPLSTPLPPLPTVIAIGQAENPLRMIVRVEGGSAPARAAAAELEAALLQRAGVTLDVQLVAREAEALAALCDSFGGQATVAWLSGTAYLVAHALKCGQPALQVTRGDDGATGGAVSIVVNNDARIAAFAALAGKTFCRVSSGDAQSWLIPALMMRAAGFQPTALKATRDYPNPGAAVAAVNAGECDAAGVPAALLERLSDAEADNLTTLATSIPIPYSILMIPNAVPLGTRAALVETLNRLADERQSALWLRDLLGQETLIPAAPEDFADLLAFGASTGLDFAALGE